MLERFIEQIINLFHRRHPYSQWIKVIVFLALVFPLILVSYIGYYHVKHHLDELVLSRKQATAHLAAVVLKEKFDHLTNIGISLADRVQFRKLIGEGKWDEAVKILKDIPIKLPLIERVFLANPAGILMADEPSLPGVRGRDFSFRDWYQGVSTTQKPYISEIYKRTAEPQYNVTAAAVPIQDDARRLLGILVMQVRVETFVEWARDIDIGESGFIYFVDRNGHVAGHPKFPSQAEIVDFSKVPAVQQALSGEKGIGTFYDPIQKEDSLIAYEQVPVYGWGIIAEQPAVSAFAARSAHLRQLIIIDGVSIIVVGILVSLFLMLINFLSVSRQKERIFLESIGDGLVAIDRSWNVVLWNKAAGLLSGWSEEEALGKPLRDILKFIREKDREENITFIEKTMLLGKAHFMEDYTLLVRKDGGEIYVADSASPVFDASSRLNGAIIIFRDISKERELEKAKEEFNSLAAHQLRNPVTAIRGYLALLEDMKVAEKMAEKSEQCKRYLDAIRSASEQLNELVNAILNVSRLEAGTLAVNPEPAYLPDVADKVFSDMQRQLKDKSIALEKHYAEDLPSMNVDIKLMQAVFQNLLSNAVKYTPEKGNIKIAIEKKEHDMLIKISDTGYGIPKEQQSKVFTKFFRADNISQKESQGTGLGLYIVKTIITQSGGKIWFESEENKGTTFYVTIPLEGMKRKEGMKGLT